MGGVRECMISPDEICRMLAKPSQARGESRSRRAGATSVRFGFCLWIGIIEVGLVQKGALFPIKLEEAIGQNALRGSRA